MEKNFPRATLDNIKVNEIVEGDGMQVGPFSVEEISHCSCPVRTKAPPILSELPFPEHEVDKLKSWIVERYAYSTFNTCEHQPLPVMTGEPLKIYTEEGAKPFAVHTPAPIPVHFRDEIKKTARHGSCPRGSGEGATQHTSHLVCSTCHCHQSKWYS